MKIKNTIYIGLVLITTFLFIIPTNALATPHSQTTTFDNGLQVLITSRYQNLTVLLINEGNESIFTIYAITAMYPIRRAKRFGIEGDSNITSNTSFSFSFKSPRYCPLVLLQIITDNQIYFAIGISLFGFTYFRQIAVIHLPS